MLETIDELLGVSSEEELAGRLGEYLGMQEPAPLAVTRRAVVDPRFMRFLTASRGRSETLRMLFDDPRNAAYDTPVPARRIDRSSLELIASAGKAMARWGASGFERVDVAVLDARLAACRKCPNLTDPPDRAVYRLRLGPRSDPRVCAACGCPVSRKARLATERCPVEDPANPGHDRWGHALPAGGG